MVIKVMTRIEQLCESIQDQYFGEDVPSAQREAYVTA